jgi:hypothetical protein
VSNFTETSRGERGMNCEWETMVRIASQAGRSTTTI